MTIHFFRLDAIFTITHPNSPCSGSVQIFERQIPKRNIFLVAILTNPKKHFEYVLNFQCLQLSFYHVLK